MSLLCSSLPSASSLFLLASETQMKVMLYVDLSKVKEASLSDQISGPLCSSPLKHWPSHSSRLLSWEREEQKCLGKEKGCAFGFWKRWVYADLCFLVGCGALVDLYRACEEVVSLPRTV